MTTPKCIPLEAVSGEAVGGKAEGLVRLLGYGFDVPSGFVIMGATPGNLPDDLDEHYRTIGAGKVAVRSSAIGEDSGEASFAGQYETVLNVEGIDALRAAIEDCLRSLENARAVAYRDEKTGQSEVQMNIVVQQMVDARAAGVLFTVNPVNARRDQVVIDAVAGLGEALVSGHATPDHWLLSRSGSVLESEVQGSDPNIERPRGYAPAPWSAARRRAIRGAARHGVGNRSERRASMASGATDHTVARRPKRARYRP